MWIRSACLVFTLLWVFSEQDGSRQPRFPECKRIVDASKKRASCSFCYTKRMREICGDICRKHGCYGSTERKSSERVSLSTTLKPKFLKLTTTRHSQATDFTISTIRSDSSQWEKNQTDDAARGRSSSSQELLTTDTSETVTTATAHSATRKTTTKSSEEKKFGPLEASGASKSNKNCDGIRPCVKIDSANKYFRQCCIDSKITKKCWDACRYNITRNELQERVVKGTCPADQMRRYMTCASSSKSSDKCCKKAGVYEGGKKFCEPLCNPNSKDWPKNREEAKHLLPCLHRFDEIFKCHWASRRNI